MKVRTKPSSKPHKQHMTHNLPNTPEKSDIDRLIRWFQANQRDFPWRPQKLITKSTASKLQLGNSQAQKKPQNRTPRNPYHTWISEIMLQQTRSEAVVAHFTRWITRFPDLQTLAQSPETEVLEAWQGLGYYSRARNILKSAKILFHENQGRIPQSRKELEALPGIGPYTAGAVLSLCFNQPEAILDGNLVRIFSRLYCITQLPSESTAGSELYWGVSRRWIQQTASPALLNEALMELGATICTPKSPRCDRCPLQAICESWKHDKQCEYPPVKKKPKPVLLKPRLLIIYRVDDQTIMLAKQNSLLLKNQWMIPAWWEASAQSEFRQWQVAFEKENKRSLPQLNTKPISHSITKYKISADVWCIHINKTQLSKKTSSSSAENSRQNPAVFLRDLGIPCPPEITALDFIHLQEAKKMVQSSLAIKALELFERSLQSPNTKQQTSSPAGKGI